MSRRASDRVRRRITTYRPDTERPIRGEEASDSGLKIIGGEGAKGPCPGSPKVNAPGTSRSSQRYSGGEDGPSSLERSTDSRCISQGFPHLKLANEHGPLNMSLVTLMLKPPTTRAQDSKNESDDDNHRQDRGGNRHYGYRPLSARHAIGEPGQTRIGSR